jgi:hypothetical protein
MERTSQWEEKETVLNPKQSGAVYDKRIAEREEVSGRGNGR